MYDWQTNPTFTYRLVQGQAVRLNEQWSGFQYLQREFGRMFPAAIKEIYKGENPADDIILIGKTPFARQVLQAL